MMTSKQSEVLWNYLVGKLTDLGDNNYTARLIYDRVNSLFKD